MAPLRLLLPALVLEAAAWKTLAGGGSDPRLLLAYLATHAGASAFVATAAVAALPPRWTRPRLPAVLLLFGASYTVPVLGFAATLLAAFILPRLPATAPTPPFRSLALPAADPHERPASGFRQAGLRAFLANSRAPEANRLRALAALQGVAGRVAAPLLRDVLADPSDDVRLLAYGLLDRQEKRLGAAIQAETRRLAGSPGGSADFQAAAHRLSDLYWELVYQELAVGDLRAHALERSLHFAGIALAGTPADAALVLRRGRLLQALGDSGEARRVYARALDLGLPKTRVIPYLAEAAYDLGDFDTVRGLMAELADWGSLPRLRPVIDYWNRQ